MPDWSTACPDWEQRILAGRPLIPFGPLFPNAAADALETFKSLRVADVAGCPTMGEICRPWLLDFVGAIFGAYDQELGKRLITEFFLLISKKNAKSTGAAGIMMTALVKNWRESAEFLILAPTLEVANNSFFPARDMVRKDPEMAALMHVQEHYRTITNRTTGAQLKVVTADDEVVGGKKATGILVDELWQFGSWPDAENMLLEATGGLAARPEGFIIYCTTQSDAPPAGVFKQKLEYARGVRDGVIADRRFLPVLYEFPQKILDEDRVPPRKYWGITNPNLGASVDPEFVERKLSEAHLAGAASVTGVLAKHLNIQIGQRLRADRWPGADFWESAGDATLTLDELLRRSEVVVVGGDGGGLDDLLGIAVIGREAQTGKWLHWGHAWAHEIVLERRKDIAPTLRDFAKAGELTLVKSPGHDVTEFVNIVCRIRDAGLLPERNAIGVDAVGINDIVDELVSRKFSVEGENAAVKAISQGWKLSAAIKTAERKVAGREIIHCAQLIMAWCVGNAKVEPRGNAVLITKQISGSAKIDPLMAFFDGVSLMGLGPPAAKKKFQAFTV